MQSKKGLLQEFKDFIWSGDLIMIAVGLILALYVQTVIDQFMKGVVFPILAAIVGKPNFDDFGFDLGKSRVSVGLVITAIVNLIIVGIVLFGVVKAYQSVQNKKKAAGEAAPTEVELLTEIRDSLRNRQG
jgi:large conductance mechanosensitive channel